MVDMLEKKLLLLKIPAAQNLILHIIFWFLESRLFLRKNNAKKDDDSIKKKLKMKIFFKTVNKKHIFPTRYFVDLNLEQQNLINQVSKDLFKLKSGEDISDKSPQKARTLVNNIFMDKYFSGKNKWFFKKLRF